MFVGGSYFASLGLSIELRFKILIKLNTLICIYFHNYDFIENLYVNKNDFSYFYLKKKI